MKKRLTTTKWSVEDTRLKPVDEIGLPIRIVHAAEAENIHNFGDLQDTSIAALQEMPGLGPKSIALYRERLTWINDLLRKGLEIKSLIDWMKRFLREDEFDVLSLRYGFYRTESGASSNFYSLQDIANQTGRTRERIRQIEHSARAMMSKELPQAGLKAAALEIETWIKHRDQIVFWEEFDHIRPVTWADSTTLSALSYFILSQTDFTGTLTPFYASTFHESDIRLITQQLINPTRPLLPVSETATRVSGITASRAEREKLCRAISWSDPNMLLTNDDHCGPIDPSLQLLIAGIINQHNQALHYRDITHAVNKRLPVKKQIGAGRILNELQKSECRWVDFGLYSGTGHDPDSGNSASM